MAGSAGFWVFPPPFTLKKEKLTKKSPLLRGNNHWRALKSAQDVIKGEGKYLKNIWKQWLEKQSNKETFHTGTPKTSDYSSLGWPSTDLCLFGERRREIKRSGKIERGIVVRRPVLFPFSVAKMHEFQAGQVNNFLQSKLGLSLLEVSLLWVLFAPWRAKDAQMCQLMEVCRGKASDRHLKEVMTLTLAREYLGVCQRASAVKKEV